MDRRLAVTLGIAAALHAVAIASVRSRRDVRRSVAPVETTRPVEMFAYELLEPAPSEPAPAAIATTAAPAPAPQRPARTTPMNTIALAIPGATAAASGEPAAAAPAPTAEPAAPTKAPFPSLLNLDAPGAHAVIFPSASAEATTKDAAMAKKLDAQLKSAIDSKDTANGTGFGGPLVSVAHAAAASSSALGYATFDVSTDALGVVTMVRVVDFGGDTSAWKDVGKRIEASGIKLRVPSGASGVAVRVRVEAAMKYPSGATTKFQPVPLGFGFDVADIGQDKKRVVAVRVVAESRL